eukprot:PhM_4_TR5204/c0_g1_i2/m.98936
MGDFDIPLYRGDEVDDDDDDLAAYGYQLTTQQQPRNNDDDDDDTNINNTTERPFSARPCSRVGDNNDNDDGNENKNENEEDSNENNVHCPPPLRGAQVATSLPERLAFVRRLGSTRSRPMVSNVHQVALRGQNNNGNNKHAPMRVEQRHHCDPMRDIPRPATPEPEAIASDDDEPIQIISGNGVIGRHHGYISAPILPRPAPAPAATTNTNGATTNTTHVIIPACVEGCLNAEIAVVPPVNINPKTMTTTTTVGHRQTAVSARGTPTPKKYVRRAHLVGTTPTGKASPSPYSRSHSHNNNAASPSAYGRYHSYNQAITSTSAFLSPQRRPLNFGVTPVRRSNANNNSNGQAAAAVTPKSGSRETAGRAPNSARRMTPRPVPVSPSPKSSSSVATTTTTTATPAPRSPQSNGNTASTAATNNLSPNTSPHYYRRRYQR